MTGQNAQIFSLVKWGTKHTLNNKDWKGVEERIEKRLSSWEGKMFSMGDNSKEKTSVDQLYSTQFYHSLCSLSLKYLKGHLRKLITIDRVFSGSMTNKKSID
jgi:hypothetical protein